MNILITDDERPARAELQFILTELMPDATFLEARNGREALGVLAETACDVVFLDINMPELDGLQTAAQLTTQSDPPIIIFATAYDQHALRAFDLAAVDYIVKPFDEKRLAQTAERIQQLLAKPDPLAAQAEALRTYLEKTVAKPVQPQLTKLWGEKENGNRQLVDYSDILYLESSGKKLYMHTAVGEALQIKQTLKEIEDRLNHHHFLRIHKAYIVNLNHISELVPWFSGNYQLHLSNGAEIPLSRRYVAQLKQRIGW